jgi:twitching motility protein PilT
MNSDPTVVVPGSVDAMLDELWVAGGSDLLLTVGARPQIRVHGSLLPVRNSEILGDAEVDRLLGQLLTGEELDSVHSGSEYDFSFTWRNLGRIRGNAFRQQGHPAIALRLIPQLVPSMAALRLPPVMSEMVTRHQGLVLVTGPTGSGKSTTIASMINQINTDRACHIVTIEDPIEFVHTHKRSIVSQREVGRDTESFAHALRAVLREDPDVVLVGEMRDLDSIRFALTIAETGHLVFGTLHTNDTAQALTRIVDVFPGEQQSQIRVQLSAALTGIVYQRLIPRTDAGMVAAYEVLVANPAVKNLIKEGKINQLRNSLTMGAKEGMVSFEQSLSVLVQSGLVRYEDAVARSLFPREIELRPGLRGGTVHV